MFTDAFLSEVSASARFALGAFGKSASALEVVGFGVEREGVGNVTAGAVIDGTVEVATGPNIPVTGGVVAAPLP